VERTKRYKEQDNEQKAVTDMADITPTMAIITLNFNGLKTPTKRQ